MSFKPDENRCLSIARELLEQPTAAMKEQLPLRAVREFVRTRPELQLTRDPAGNLLVRYEPKAALQSPRPPLVLVAHLDHPSFWIDGVSGDAVELTFKGGVHIQYVHPGQRLKFFSTDSATATGSGEVISAASETEPTPIGRLSGGTAAGGRLASARARITDGRAPSDGFAMWDFPGFSVVDGAIVTRCCDDLLGAAAALSTLDAVIALKSETPLWCLFTRAEEIGFFGAFEAIRHGTIPKNSRVVSLECSKALENARQGDGVIVRVGDRGSIFNPTLTASLRHAAEAIAKDDPSFKHQRKLMDGGSCEALVFCAAGFRASGVCVPLGNYHNQAHDANGKPTIGAESVFVSDFMGEVRLLTELSLHPEWLDEGVVEFPKSLQERAERARELTTKYIIE